MLNIDPLASIHGWIDGHGDSMLLGTGVVLYIYMQILNDSLA